MRLLKYYITFVSGNEVYPQPANSIAEYFILNGSNNIIKNLW